MVKRKKSVEKFVVKLRIEGAFPAPGDFEEYEVTGKVFDDVRKTLRTRGSKVTMLNLPKDEPYLYKRKDGVFPVCKKCEGTGRSTKVHTRADGGTELLTCKDCFGSGHGKFDSRKCPKCGGKWETSNNSPWCWCTKCKYEPGNDPYWVIQRQWEIIEDLKSNPVFPKTKKKSKK